MFDIDVVPYFPFKLTPDSGGWLIHNPITEAEYELNQATYWLLRLCDANRTWGEIIVELGRAYQVSSTQIVTLSEPLLQALTDDGMLWWRQQRMHWWRLPPPAYVLWDLTGRCNLFCRHCVVSSGPSNLNEEELSLEECHRLATELAAYGVQQLILSGGEPLIRPDFFEIAENAASQGLSLQIATNATLITERAAQRLAAIGASAQVSLDGATPEIHNDFRQCPLAWERAIQGIRYLVEADVSVMLACTVTKANIDQVPALYDLAANLGVHTFRILPFVPCGRGSTARELEVSPQEMHKVTAYLHRRRDEGGLSIAPMEFECTFAPPHQELATPQTHVGCDGAITYCTITSTGEVLPCNFFAGVEAENVKEQSFSWIWENSRFLNYFRSLTVSDIRGGCQQCAWLPICRGSCIAANFAHGDIFQSNCHCWLVNGATASNNSSFHKVSVCYEVSKTFRV